MKCFGGERLILATGGRSDLNRFCNVRITDLMRNWSAVKQVTAIEMWYIGSELLLSCVQLHSIIDSAVCDKPGPKIKMKTLNIFACLGQNT